MARVVLREKGLHGARILHQQTKLPALHLTPKFACTERDRNHQAVKQNVTQRSLSRERPPRHLAFVFRSERGKQYQNKTVFGSAHYAPLPSSTSSLSSFSRNATKSNAHQRKQTGCQLVAPGQGNRYRVMAASRGID